MTVLPAAAADAGARARLSQVDLLKAVASQLIVLHHLAFYGPMADHAAPLSPSLFDALSQHARLAVQVFLVVAGFLAARRLAPGARLPSQAQAWTLAVERYLRLVLPFAAMLLLAIVASAVARRWMDHPSISAPPDAWQLLAHLLLLHDVVGVEALSAGVWYVAIDLQLFVLLLLTLVLARSLDRRWPRAAPTAPWLVLALAAWSLLHVNRDAGWDVWAPYFFGSYGLGVLVAWTAPQEPPCRGARLPLLALAAVVAVSLAIEFRSRIALAAGVAVVLAVVSRRDGLAAHWSGGALAGWLGRISYAVFLVHFPVCLLVNAFFERFVPHDALLQFAGVLFAWAVSVAAGALFHRAVEAPAMRWVTRWTARVRAARRVEAAA